MFKKITSFFLVLLFSLFISTSFSNVFAATLTCSDDLTGKVFISEFSSATNPEWVELMNIDADNSVDLSNCGIAILQRSGSGLSSVAKTLTGSLPRGGFLTFSLDYESLDDAGAVLSFQDSTGTNTYYAVSYGSYTPAQTVHVAVAPSSSQSAQIPDGSGSWNLATATKGWCNLGFTGCPSISDIITGMNSNGVKTNLDTMTDYSRVSGLYFQKSETNDPNGNPIGKITFLSEMNFTDKDALSWMGQMDTNVDMSTKGKIGLNAELIKNLTATNASLTMYGLSYNDPIVDVTNADGSAGDGSIVSGLTYDKVAGTLTFTAAHFTTFTSKEKTTTGSSSSSSPTTPGCSNQVPDHSPDLFQIDTTKNKAKLFFTPVNNAVDYYYIAYGFTEGDERFGVRFDKGYYDGVIDYTINELSPNTKYYYKVRAGNGCATGAWSNWMKAKTDGVYIQTIQTIPDDTITPEPTKSVKSPTTLGVSDSVAPSKSVTPPEVKKSWWKKIVEYILR